MNALRFIALLAVLAASTCAFALPGDLDPSFGASGAVPSDLLPIAGLQPDGKLLVVGTTQQGTGDPNHPVKLSWLIRRYAVDGSPDFSFGTNGAVAFSFDVLLDCSFLFAGCPAVLGDDSPIGIDALPDGRFVIAGNSRGTCIAAVGEGTVCATAFIAARFNADGTLDSSYGIQGKIIDRAGIADSFVVQSDGRLVTLVTLGTFILATPYPYLQRYNLDGSQDKSFPNTNGCVGKGTLRVTPDDKIVVVTAPVRAPPRDGFCITRLNPDGSPDTGFGQQGLATAGTGSAAFLADFLLDASGSIVIAGSLANGTPNPAQVMFRLGPDGQLDNGFGSDGRMQLDALRGISGIAADCHGRILVAGSPSTGLAYFSIVRLLEDGAPDPTFIAGPPSSTPTNLDSYTVDALIVRSNGRVLALAVQHLGSSAPSDLLNILQYVGDSPCEATVAVEYYCADWNYYFETAFPDEIAALDAGAFGGAWKRTGETFNVWAQPTGATSPTCRFFSTEFAPKSSHFYTPFPAECASVRAGSGWQFEGIAFHVEIPTGYGTGNGSCPQGTVPLYRAYNNGMGGAPNHRYTTSLSTLNAMITQGWSFEGEANTKVFACVPQ